MTFNELTSPEKSGSVDTAKLDFYGKEALSQPRLAKESITNYDFLVFDSHENWSRLLRLDQASPTRVSWLEIPHELQRNGVLTGKQLMNLIDEMNLSTLRMKRNIIELNQGEKTND